MCACSVGTVVRRRAASAAVARARSRRRAPESDTFENAFTPSTTSSCSRRPGCRDRRRWPAGSARRRSRRCRRAATTRPCCTSPSTSRPSGWSGNTASASAECDLVVRRVLGQRELFQDDLALGVDVSVARSAGSRQHVAQQVEPEAELVGRKPRVVRGVLSRGEGVHLAADGVDAIRRCLSRFASAVPLNTRCSRKCDAPAKRAVLVAAADADPEAGRHRSGLGHPLREDGDAVGQDGPSNFGFAQVVNGADRHHGRGHYARRRARRSPRPPRSRSIAAHLGRTEVAELLARLFVEASSNDTSSRPPPTSELLAAVACVRAEPPALDPAGALGAAAWPPAPSPSGVMGLSDTLPFGSTSSTRTSISSPSSSTSSTRSMRLPPPIFEMCSSPSRPGRMLTNAPNFVMLTTRPL